MKELDPFSSIKDTSTSPTELFNLLISSIDSFPPTMLDPIFYASLFLLVVYYSSLNVSEYSLPSLLLYM
jgi:hypothetical protein